MSMLDLDSTPSKFFECKFSIKSGEVLNLGLIYLKYISDVKSWNINVKLVLSASKLTGVEIFE